MQEGVPESRSPAPPRRDQGDKADEKRSKQVRRRPVSPLRSPRSASVRPLRLDERPRSPVRGRDATSATSTRAVLGGILAASSATFSGSLARATQPVRARTSRRRCVSRSRTRYAAPRRRCRWLVIALLAVRGTGRAGHGSGQRRSATAATSSPSSRSRPAAVRCRGDGTVIESLLEMPRLGPRAAARTFSVKRSSRASRTDEAGFKGKGEAGQHDAELRPDRRHGCASADVRGARRRPDRAGLVLPDRGLGEATCRHRKARSPQVPPVPRTASCCGSRPAPKLSGSGRRRARPRHMQRAEAHEQGASSSKKLQKAVG